MSRKKILVIISVIVLLVIIIGTYLIWINATTPKEDGTNPILTPTPSLNPDPISYSLGTTWNLPTQAILIPANSYSTPLNLGSYLTSNESQPKYNSTYYHFANYDSYSSSLNLQSNTPAAYYLYVDGSFNTKVYGDLKLPNFGLSTISFGNPNNYTISINVSFQGTQSHTYYRSDVIYGNEWYYP